MVDTIFVLVKILSHKVKQAMFYYVCCQLKLYHTIKHDQSKSSKSAKCLVTERYSMMFYVFIAKRFPFGQGFKLRCIMALNKDSFSICVFFFIILFTFKVKEANSLRVKRQLCDAAALMGCSRT